MRRPPRKRFAWVLLVPLLMAAAAHGEEGEAAAEPEGELEHRNELAMFLGLTDVDAELRSTLGFDYERRLTQRLGAGLVADWVFGGDGREFVLAPAGFFRPVPPVRLTLAVGLQRDREAREIEGVLRLGAEYVIELGERWSLAPAVSVDFVSDETISVFGVAVGYAF